MAAEKRTIQGIVNGEPEVTETGAPSGEPRDYVILGREAEWRDSPPREISIQGQSIPVALEGGGDFMARGVRLTNAGDACDAVVTKADGSAEDVRVEIETVY